MCKLYSSYFHTKACQLQAISSESVTDKSVIRTGTSAGPVPSVTNVWSPSIHQFKLWKRLGSYNTHAYTAVVPVPNVAMQTRHNCVILQSCSVLLCVVVRLFEITAMTLWKTFSQPFKGLFEGSSKGLALRCNGWSFISVRHHFPTPFIPPQQYSQMLPVNGCSHTVLWFISTITDRTD